MAIRFTFVVAWMVGSLSVFAQGQIPLTYVKLVRAVNYVQELRSSPTRIAQDNAIFATKLACEGLREVAADKELHNRVSATAAATSEYESQNTAVRGSLGLFLDEFLSPELIVLERAGLSTAAARQIVEDSRILQSQAYIGKYGKGSEEPFLRNLENLTNEICRAAAQATLIVETKKSDLLFRVGVASAGVMIVVADMYLTPTPTGALAVQSYSFGMSFVSGAILK